MKHAILSLIILLQTAYVFGQCVSWTIEPFTGLDVVESIKLYLTKGNSNVARIETNGVNTDKVLLENSGRRLKIHMKSGSWRNFDAKVYLEFKELNDIDVSSSADLIGKSTITGDDLEIEVSSSGSAVLDIDVNELNVDVSSSGKLELTGKTKYQRVDVNSSGKLYAFGLESQRARVEASSSGKAEINASSELEAEANSSGRIRYQGNPEKIFVSSNSGGSIRKN